MRHGKYRYVALPAPYELPQCSIQCERFGRSQFQRHIRKKIPLEGIGLDDMGSSTIQAQIVLPNAAQIISK
jgi:hypothetical protein